jgi:hypothetical protein
MADSAEEWRDVAEAPGYKVSNLGNVLGKRGTPLTLITNQFGYKVVSPLVNGKTSTRQVHRLVAIAFIPNPDALPLVSHIDGDRLNNRVSNLEWVTPKQNAERAVNRAEESTRRSRKVVQTFPDGHTETWGSMKEAAGEVGVTASTIGLWCSGRAADPRGHGWEFADETEALPLGEKWRRVSLAEPTQEVEVPESVEVSSYGRLRLPNGQIIRGTLKGKYYRYRNHGVHRLVAAAFCELRPGCATVNHLDGDPANNRASNLEWTTQVLNCAHAHATGLCRRKPVRRRSQGGTVTEYPSVREASRVTGASASNIVLACQGKLKKVYNASWEYAGAVSREVSTSPATPVHPVAHVQQANAPAVPSQNEPPSLSDADVDELLANLAL